MDKADGLQSGSLQRTKQRAKIWDTGTKGTDPRNGCPIFGRVVPRTNFSGRYPQYLVSLIWTVSCRCLRYVILDYLFASGYIFLFTSTAGVNFPVREREDDDVREIPAVGAPLHSTRSLH